MFFAMNAFSVNPGREADFENAWKSRETYLDEVPGIVRFALLKGDNAGEYLSHTTWQSRGDFEAWTKSAQFRAAHGQTAMTGVLAGPPKVSLYHAVLEQEMLAGV